MSVARKGEITIKLFWKNLGFFENSVTIRGNRDIEKIPWVNKEGKEQPFASFLLKEKSKEFCQSIEINSWNFSNLGYGKHSSLQCKLKEGADLTWKGFEFTRR